MLIVIPNAVELNLPIRHPLTSNRLDRTIEVQDLKNMFFVRGSDFVDATIQRLGCEDTPENRRRIRKAFNRANHDIIIAIVEGEMKSRQNA